VRADVVRMYACPTCGAKTDDPCRDKTGREKTRHCSSRVAAARECRVALATEICPAHPGEFAPPDTNSDDRSHACMADEMRCAYCGVRLAPYPCHACGKFLTARRMHEAGSGAIPHCEECLP